MGDRGERSERVATERLVREQIDYYRARAAEYDQWFERRGRYDRGPALNRRWHAEVAIVRGALADFLAPLAGAHLLELAPGTGIWTSQLLAGARRVTAIDASPEMLALQRQRLGAAAARLEQIEADLFDWDPPARYDAVFFAFWLSHVPESRFDAFWRLVDRALRPGGRVFLVDSRYAPTSTARDHRLGPADAGRVTRRLDDGRSFEIVKMFHAPPALRARLAALGWEFEVGATAHYFIHAAGGRRPAAEA